MSPVILGIVHSAMERKNTTCGKERKHVLPIKYKITNTNHCLGTASRAVPAVRASYFCTLDSYLLYIEQSIRQQPYTCTTNHAYNKSKSTSNQMQTNLASGLISNCFETRLPVVHQCTLGVDAKRNIQHILMYTEHVE